MGKYLESSKSNRVEHSTRIMKDSKSNKGAGRYRDGKGKGLLKKDSSEQNAWQNLLNKNREKDKTSPGNVRNVRNVEKAAMAAALKYDPGEDETPKISALGKGVIAENIIRAANESKVPVYRDEHLVSTLNKLRIGDGIPQELFEVVAEVLVFITKSDARFREKINAVSK